MCIGASLQMNYLVDTKSGQWSCIHSQAQCAESRFETNVNKKFQDSVKMAHYTVNYF